MKHLDNYIQTLVKNSKLNKQFKSEILESEPDDIIIELDSCLDFLEKRGFKIFNLTEEEDVKLENYLKKYFSENIPNFPYAIYTEDGVEIFNPNKKYSFSKDELPKKFPKKTNLYTVNFNFLDLRPFDAEKCNIDRKNYMGRQNWYSFLQIGGLPKEEAEQLKNMIENEKWNEIDFNKYYKDNKKDYLDYILNHRSDFELEVNMVELKPSEIR